MEETECKEYKAPVKKCGFCGKEIEDDQSYIAYKTGRRYRYTYGDLIPVITVHSICCHQDVELCDDCKADILEKVCRNMPGLKDNLLKTSEWEIVHDKENRQRDSEYLRDFNDFKELLGRYD